MSLAAWMPSSLRFFSICLLRAIAARSSADEAHPMAIARTAWLATRGSAVPLACSRPVVARTSRRARARSRTRLRPATPAPPRDSRDDNPALHARHDTFGLLEGERSDSSRLWWRRGVDPRTNDESRSSRAPHLLRTPAPPSRLSPHATRAWSLPQMLITPCTILMQPVFIILCKDFPTVLHQWTNVDNKPNLNWLR